MSQQDLQDEFDNYTNPSGFTVDTSRTVFLDDKIGNGLSNAGDYLILKNNAGDPVDCVSWDGSDICKSLTYVPGGNGKDQLNKGANGESIVNIQGEWYDGEPNASPYNHINTANGGSPTAVTIPRFSFNTAHVSRWSLSLLFLAGATTGLAFARKKTPL